jgi:hypothetical protein
LGYRVIRSRITGIIEISVIFPLVWNREAEAMLVRAEALSVGKMDPNQALQVVKVGGSKTLVESRY